MLGNSNQNQGASQQQQQSQQQEGGGKVYRYRCAAACTFGGSYRKEGDIIESAVELKAPHFKPVENSGKKPEEK